jgi:hypothetical protein
MAQSNNDLSAEDWLDVWTGHRWRSWKPLSRNIPLEVGPPGAGPPGAGLTGAGPPRAGPPGAGPPGAGPPVDGPPGAGPPGAGPPGDGLTGGGPPEDGPPWDGPPRHVRRRAPQDSNSYTGVSFVKERKVWRSSMWHGGMKICLNLGDFDSEEDAARWHDLAVLLILGTGTYTIFQPADYSEKVLARMAVYLAKKVCSWFKFHVLIDGCTKPYITQNLTMYNWNRTLEYMAHKHIFDWGGGLI